MIIRTTERNVQALFEVKNILNKLRTQYKPIIQAGLKPGITKVYNNVPNSADIKFPGIQFGDNGNFFNKSLHEFLSHSAPRFTQVKMEKSVENDKGKTANNNFLLLNGAEPTLDESTISTTAINHEVKGPVNENIRGHTMNMVKLTSLLGSQKTMINLGNYIHNLYIYSTRNKYTYSTFFENL